MTSQRRGACPGVEDPLPTGDGLLARLLPAGPIALEVFAALCEASRRHGNGIVEVTQRGSLQIRGLTAASAVPFADAIGALGLNVPQRPPLLTSPLLGLQADEPLDLRGLVADLRTAFMAASPLSALHPKVSVLVDGGGTLPAQHLAADVRLQAGSAASVHLSIAGTAAAAAGLGWVALHDAVPAVLHVLAAIARRGPRARARDLTHAADWDALRTGLAPLLSDAPAAPAALRDAEPLAAHRLHDGRLARGVALAFGHADASLLEWLVRTAARLGASALRPAPGRALLVLGLSAAGVHELVAESAAAGFIVHPDDARRYVVACAGAPACASARLATRQLAPALARAARAALGPALTVHLSGCSKGCAHPGAAALTLVGPAHLVVAGRAGDPPHGTIAPAQLLAGLARRCRDAPRAPLGPHHRAAGSSRPAAAQVVEWLGGRRL